MMNIEQVMGGESVAKSPDAGNRTASGEDAHPSGLSLVTSITQTYLGSAVTETLEAHAEGVLPSIASDKVHFAPPSSDSHVSIIGDPAILQKSLPAPSSAIEETVHAIESSAGSPIALVDDVANITVIGATEDIKDKAQALVLTRLRAVVFVYAAKLPVVGSYFVQKHVGEPNVDTFATETTPLLGALHDPKAFATEQAEGLLRRLLSPLLRRIPDVDALDNVESDNFGPLFKTFVECYVLARDGGGWLL